MRASRDVERAPDTLRSRAFPLILDQPGYWKQNAHCWAGASLVPPELVALFPICAGPSRIADPLRCEALVSHVDAAAHAASRRRCLSSRRSMALEGFALMQSVSLPQGSRYEIRIVEGLSVTYYLPSGVNPRNLAMISHAWSRHGYRTTP